MAFSYLCSRFGDGAPRLRGEQQVFDNLRGRYITAKRMWLICNAYDYAELKGVGHREAFERGEAAYIGQYINYLRSKKNDSIQKSRKI